MISSLLASDSVGMIYFRSNIDDNLIWVLSVHVWHSEGARSEIYWFGLYRGCATSTWPKININAQKPPACKISGHFVHWGPFYGTPLSENRDFALPLFHTPGVRKTLIYWIGLNKMITSKICVTETWCINLMFEREKSYLTESPIKPFLIWEYYSCCSDLGRTASLAPGLS